MHLTTCLMPRCWQNSGEPADPFRIGRVTSWTLPDLDRPPGPLAGLERPQPESLLAWHRTTFLPRCAGLPSDQLAARSMPLSTLTLLGLVRHIAGGRDRLEGAACALPSRQR